MGKALVFVLALALSGCTVTYVAMNPIMPTADQNYSMKIGDTHEALLGDTMISKTDAMAFSGFIASTDYQPPYGKKLIRAGSEWAIVGQLADGGYVCKNDDYEKMLIGGPSMTAGVLLGLPQTNRPANTNRVSDLCLLVNSADEPYGFTWYAQGESKVAIIAWPEKPQNFLKRADKVYRSGTFKQELIYNGKSGNTLKLSYREFKNDFARPAFSQELSYDLSEGKTIGFRGMKIDVLEVTNAFIKFKIKSPMN